MFFWELSNTNEIINSNLGELTAVVKFLKKYPSIKLEIGGHTDNVGDHKSNIELSKARGEKIRLLLIEKGVLPKQLKSKGYGETDALFKNDTDENRLQNRRVTIEILDGK